jgi:hypothetical protein
MACCGQATVSISLRSRELIGHCPTSISFDDHVSHGLGVLSGRGILQLPEATRYQTNAMFVNGPQLDGCVGEGGGHLP